MTTLSAQTPGAYEGGDIGSFPVIATDIIYEGSAVGLVDATGHAQPLTSSDKFVGFALAKADNSGGSAADIDVDVYTRGRIQLSVTGAVITDVGQPVYATDDNAFQFIATSAVFIGYIWRFVSAGVAIVEFDAINLKDPYAGWTHQTEASGLTSTSVHNGKCIWMSADAQTLTLPVYTAAVYGIRIINAGAYGTFLVTVDVVDSGDMVEGPDITAGDNKGVLLAQTTARRGDYVDIELVDAAGYSITAMRGAWTRKT